MGAQPFSQPAVAAPPSPQQSGPAGRAKASAADTVIETGEACHVEFDAICDTVGGEIAAAYYPNLKSGGVFCSVSTNRLPPPTRDDIVVRNFVCYPDVQKLAELAVAAASGFDSTGPWNAAAVRCIGRPYAA
ncbi:MAG: hypothetical protein M9905_01265 [Rhizobiaceae bacterium]|nr:hypothetical protein [Rhizobiaceae bacterium]